MKTVYARDLLKRDYFKTYSEFYFILALGKVLHEHGYVMNLDNVLIDTDACPDDMIMYFKDLMQKGCVELSMLDAVDSNPIKTMDVFVDVDYFKDLKLFSETNEYGSKDGNLHWSYQFARETYGEYASRFLPHLKLGNTLMHAVAYHIANCMLGLENRKLIIHLDRYKAKNTYLYVNLYAILKGLPELSKYFDLDIDFDDYNVDLDYSIYCNVSHVSGHHKILSVSEKLELMKRFGMVEGSVLALWERAGICPNNEYGRITGVSIIILNEVGDDFIGITRVALNKTKDEVRKEFYDIPEESRYLFVDTLTKSPHQERKEMDLFGMGIDNYFQDELYLLTLLDTTEEVTKLITVNGNTAEVTMKEVDAIYWLLNEYDIEFDKNLFRDMYFGEREPLWDSCH